MVMYEYIYVNKIFLLSIGNEKKEIKGDVEKKDKKNTKNWFVKLYFML